MTDDKRITVEQPIMRIVGQTGPRGAPGDKQTAFDKWALGIVVAVTALAAVYFSVVSSHRLTDVRHAQAELAQTQAAYRLQVNCNQAIVTKTVLAIKARSAFAEQQANESLRLDIAQQAYLTSIVLPNQTAQDRLDALATYQQALAFNITATRDSLRVRKLNPYPSVDDVKACG